MKKIILTSITLLVISIQTFASVKIQYSNKDKNDVILKVKIDDVIKEVTFKAGKSGSLTIKGLATECIIVSSCGEVPIKSGAEIEIINGCIKK